MWRSLVQAVIFVLFGASAALAIDPTPPDCSIAGYGDSFGEAPHAAEFRCHTRFSRSFTSNGAPRVARIIEDARTENRTPEATLAALERGVDAAVYLFLRLSDVSMQHVAVLAFNGVSPRPDARGEIQAVTNGHFGAEECYITYYLGASMLSELEVSVSVAHEIFHCMQYATLSEAQMNTYGAGGDWWIEGAAEALADLALPGSGTITDRSDVFATSVRAHTALIAMSHETTPLFQWLIAKKGVQGMLRFQAAMAGGSSEAAQHAAMRAAMSDADWLGFVEAYSENQIAGADGVRLADPAPEMPALDFTASREVALTPAPFVLNYGDVTYHCGTWRNSVAPAGMAAVKIGEIWGDWPADLESIDGGASPMRFAAINTGSEGARHMLSATLATPCEACGETAAVDACLVGSWLLTGGGPVEWIRANGMGRLAEVEVSEIAIQILANGRYTTLPITARVQTTESEVEITSEGVGTGGGRWSAQGGTLTICPSEGAVTAVTRIGGSAPMPMALGVGPQRELSYSCAGATLNASAQINAALPPMDFTFSRQ